MKNTILYSNLVCMVCLLFIACEKAEVGKYVLSDNAQLSTRTEDCTDCEEIADCCCRIEHVSSGNASIELCGTLGERLTENLCGPFDGPCGEISGYYLSPLTLSSGNGFFFCVDENTPFVVNVPAGGCNARISCRMNDTSPPWTNVTLSPGRFYFTTDENCDLAPCN
jgi:hypothetical protein